MPTADADLVVRAAAGDKDAFGEIFERYQHLVYRFARAMTGSPDAAEDVTQEVFVVLIRELHRYRPERAMLSTYLYGIARNVSRDRLRRDRRLLAFLARGVMLTAGVQPDDPFANVASAEVGIEVRRALARMPVKHREVVILCDLHGLSYAEVGTVLRITTAAVRARLHRGRHLLRQRLLRTKPGGARETARSSIRCSV
jgi:RNA polymerase sigma-70 factor (ECF subfamily)